MNSGVPARVDGSVDPSSELDATARWGIASKRGVCMPSKGKSVERAYTPDEQTVLAAGAAALGLDADTVSACLGATTFDVYLNNVAFWRCVPERVWGYTLGGYQVMKKWLSYREHSLLGRADAGGTDRSDADGPPHRRVVAVATGAGCELSGGEEKLCRRIL